MGMFSDLARPQFLWTLYLLMYQCLPWHPFLPSHPLLHILVSLCLGLSLHWYLLRILLRYHALYILLWRPLQTITCYGLIKITPPRLHRVLPVWAQLMMLEVAISLQRQSFYQRDPALPWQHLVETWVWHLHNALTPPPLPLERLPARLLRDYRRFHLWAHFHSRRLHRPSSPLLPLDIPVLELERSPPFHLFLPDSLARHFQRNFLLLPPFAGPHP
jgi:hypothetical protein